MLAGLLVALCIALGYIAKSPETLAFDQHVHRVARGHMPTASDEDDASFRTRAMRLGPDIGTATVLFAPLTALALWHQRRRRAAALVLLSVGGAFLLTLCLKGIFQRARADHTCSHGPLCVIGYLYPSTHTVLTVVTYGLIAALIAPFLTGWRRSLVLAAYMLLIGFVAFSLVYLNTHYLTDVLGGLLFGSAWLILSLFALRVIEEENGA